MSQEHKKSRGHTDKMYILFGHKIISINLQHPGQNKDWKGVGTKSKHFPKIRFEGSPNRQIMPAKTPFYDFFSPFFFIIFIANHHDTREGSIRIIF